MRERIARFNAEGIDGLGDRPGAGRKPRLTEEERGPIIALARSDPPGKPVRMGEELEAVDPEKEAQWSLDALASAAHEKGIQVERSQIRRILLKEGIRWRRPRSWAESTDPDLVPKRARIVTLYTAPPDGATIRCLDELGPVSPRTFPPAPGWSPDGHRIKALLDYGRGPDKVWVYGALRPSDGQTVTFTAPSRNTAGFLKLLETIDAANPVVDLYLINDNLSSHFSWPIRQWLSEHPRVHQEPVPTGACRWSPYPTLSRYV